MPQKGVRKDKKKGAGKAGGKGKPAAKRQTKATRSTGPSKRKRQT